MVVMPLPPCLPSLSPDQICAALRCRCRLISQACPPIRSVLLFAAAAALSPKLVPLHDQICAALRCRCRLVSQACLPSWSPFCTTIDLFRFQPPATGQGPASPIHRPGTSLTYPPARDQPHLSTGQAKKSIAPFCAALAPDHLHGGRCRLVSSACPLSWSPFWAALGCRRHLFSQFLPLMISFPQEPMVSEHLRIRNKSCCFLNVQKTHFASLEMLSGVYAGVICWTALFVAFSACLLIVNQGMALHREAFFSETLHHCWPGQIAQPVEASCSKIQRAHGKWKATWPKWLSMSQFQMVSCCMF